RTPSGRRPAPRPKGARTDPRRSPTESDGLAPGETGARGDAAGTRPRKGRPCRNSRSWPRGTDRTADDSAGMSVRRSSAGRGGRPPFGTSATIADTISRSWPSRGSPTNMSSQKFLSPAWRNGKIRDPTIRIRRYFHRPMIGTLTPYLKFASVRVRPRMGGERTEDAGRDDTLLPGFQSLGPPEPSPPRTALRG